MPEINPANIYLRSPRKQDNIFNFILHILSGFSLNLYKGSVNFQFTTKDDCLSKC
jgi:hypothetical protein